MLTLYLIYLDDENDKKLFEDIFYSYRKQMVKLALFILHNEDDAEDAVHDVFLHIAMWNMDVIRRIKDRKDIRNYFLKATKHRALDIIRNRRSSDISLDTISEYAIGDIKDLSDDTFLKEICARSECEMVIEAMESLGEKYRDALYYHFIMEMTVHETAKLLGQPKSTTKQQLVRGKRMLLELLKRKGVENIGN